MGEWAARVRVCSWNGSRLGVALCATWPGSVGQAFSSCPSATGNATAATVLLRQGFGGHFASRQNARAGRAQSVRKRRSWGWCLVRAPRDLFFRPEKTQWRSYGAARGHAFRKQGPAASITEAAKLTIGAFSSPSRVAPGPILATLGIRSSLAPNLHFRRTCTETPACVSRTFGFLCSHRSSGAQSHDHLPHHAHSTSPELMVAVPSTSRQETR